MKTKVNLGIYLFVFMAACALMGIKTDKVQATDNRGYVSLVDDMIQENSATDTEYVRTKGNDLNFGTVQITELGTNKVGVYGLTQAHRVCTTVYLYLYLEQMQSNGSFTTYDYWKYTASKATSLTKSLNVLVPKNHYYRLKGAHATLNGGTKESVSTLTDSIFIGDTIVDV